MVSMRVLSIIQNNDHSIKHINGLLASRVKKGSAERSSFSST
jgi:hypothetical protein